MNRLFLLFMLVVSGKVQAQSVAPPALQAKIIPPSPEAAALGSFGNENVGLFTGTPSVSIPVYALKTKHLTLPVTLNYSSNGMKIDELSSRVGMNWVLDVGGVVTRTVYDKADELHSSLSLPPSTNFNYDAGNPDLPLLSWLEVAGGSQFDMQLDEFNFNCGS